MKRSQGITKIGKRLRMGVENEEYTSARKGNCGKEKYLHIVNVAIECKSFADTFSKNFKIHIDNFLCVAYNNI